jgi:hypothetical protein
MNLSIADFMYFFPLSVPGALIGVVSTLRRGSVMVSFLGGAIYFKTVILKSKTHYSAWILAGILILSLGAD